ncbi:hypothetical protein SEUCBS139899_009843 [Sporothrix eucalyptigena]|uniref:Uncharacterized protein n=1 Tax=Sporothrix eucalyptigena TaxID=1812306 RepID=A0ABP0CZ39_9PEZI
MTLLKRVADEELATLSGKTIIITGGASGIGKAAAKIAYDAGANIAIADLRDDIGEELAKEFPARTIYVKADVSSWPDVLNLFKKTWHHFGAIDVVLSNAGTHAFESLQEEALEENGDPTAPSVKSLEVNLNSAVYCTKAAVHFFKKQPHKKCQLVFTSSAAGVSETPPLYIYGAGKAGVIGLMRGLRLGLLAPNMTVNVIAPWMTSTPFIPDDIREKWGDLPMNDADGVAKALLLPAVRPDLNGKTLWVADNETVEIEDTIRESQPQWLGSRWSALADEGALRLGFTAQKK